MKILLFGKDGLLGNELKFKLGQLGNVVALNRHKTNFLSGNIINFDELIKTIRTFRPDIVVNAAAYTNVEKAEIEYRLAYKTNSEALEIISYETRVLESILVHYSTNYVFDGISNKSWNEDDFANPIGVYGKSKLQGENIIKSSGCKYLILRTGWVYGIQGNNFISKILQLAQEARELKVVNDQVGSPTNVSLLADLSIYAICKIQKDARLYGLYHLTSCGITSWYEYAFFILSWFKNKGFNLKIGPNQIISISSDNYAKSIRPLNSMLNCNLFERKFSVKIPHWKTEVSNYLLKYNNFLFNKN
ncbi:MAG: dTDP-4-dehydrorhamnose reductase [Bordetella sp.]|nr:MAG: dTDP-4-dehydrorhamnose reductase [Bordetella sp.]